MAKFEWEKLEGIPVQPEVQRAKVSGGWLVFAMKGYAGGLSFLPDPNHRWDGGTYAPGETDI